ncbi:hypothetical protein OKW26_003540 [Paraburkholderia sp. 32]
MLVTRFSPDSLSKSVGPPTKLPTKTIRIPSAVMIVSGYNLYS